MLAEFLLTKYQFDLINWSIIVAKDLYNYTIYYTLINTNYWISIHSNDMLEILNILKQFDINITIYNSTVNYFWFIANIQLNHNKSFILC
jgi:hypothetical protein